MLNEFSNKEISIKENFAVISLCLRLNYVKSTDLHSPKSGSEDFGVHQ